MYQTALIGILALGVMATQRIGSDRFHVAHVCLWSYVANLAIGYEGGYIYQSLWELGIIAALYFIPGKLSILVMRLCLAAIFVNLFSWRPEGYSDPVELNEAIMLVLFTVQMMFIFSRRLTDGSFRMGERFHSFCINCLTGSDHLQSEHEK